MKKSLLFGLLLTVCVVIISFVFSQFYPGGMIAYWKFDETEGVIAYDSVGNNDGVLINGPTRTNGLVGGALSFDGLNDFVEIPAMGIDFSQMSLEGWIYVRQNKTQKVFRGEFSHACFGTHLGYWERCQSAFGSPIILNSWHHVAIVDGVGVYIDGVLEIPSTMGGLTSTEILYIGGPPFNEYFNGLIDEVAIYNRPLTPTEIQQHYLNGLNGMGYEVECVPAPDGLVSWWPGDGDADDIVDGNHGILANGATFANGMVGQAFSFDGNNDYVSIGNMGPFPTEGTIDFWMKADAVQNYRNPFTTNYIGGNAGIRFEEVSSGIGYTNSFYAVVGDDGGNYCGHIFRYTATQSPYNNPMLANTWYHVALVWDSTANSIKGYWDGELAFDEYHSCWPTTLPNVAIGSGYSSARYWDGLVDEVEIFDRALSASEIQAIYHAGSAGKCKVRTVDIDIKPGSYPNSINLGSNGNVPVAIFSTEDFDATTIDPLSVTLAGASVRIKGKGTPQASASDVDGDGLLDILVHVDTSTLELSAGDVEAILEGETFDGQLIRGVDTVRIVKE